MKTILILLSISPFLLEKANSWADLSEIKYGQWRPHYIHHDEPTGRIYARGPRKCINCAKGPEIFPVRPHGNRPSFPRHWRPHKQNRRISYKFPEIPDGQPDQIPGSREIVVIPERRSPGSGPIIPVPCVPKPKKCPFKGPREWNDPVVPDLGSLQNVLDSCECGITDYPMMIIQGSVVDPPFKYPWMVAIQRRDGLTFCGGSIVSDQYILTAAHCMAKGTAGFYNPGEIQVAFVTNTFEVSKGEEVTNIIPHPLYEYLNKDHDIALLKLRKKIQCSEERRPICLPDQGRPVHVDMEFGIAGWGSREGGTPDSSPVLMETTIKLVDFSRCAGLFNELRHNFHCLHGVEDSSPCHGDSGGPMFSEDGNRYYVFGVASMHKSRECDPNDVFVYTKVSNYADWIRSEIRH